MADDLIAQEPAARRLVVVIEPMPKPMTLPVIACRGCGAERITPLGWPLATMVCTAPSAADPSAACGHVGFRVACSWAAPGEAEGNRRIPLLRLKTRSDPWL